MKEVKDLADLRHTLMQAKDEIQRLRHSNELLAAQAYVVEVFASALGMRRSPTGETVDIVWYIDDKIRTLEQLEKDHSGKKTK